MTPIEAIQSFYHLFDLVWQRTSETGVSDTVYLSYTEASQVAGYTAIGGGTTGGLFRSNRNLNREISKNLELGTVLRKDDWSFEGCHLSIRWDDDLTDWTFDSSDTKDSHRQ